MRSKAANCLVAVLGLIQTAVVPAFAQPSELDQLKSAMQAMQKNMEEMQRKIDALEQASANPGTNAPGTNAAESVTFAVPTNALAGHAAPVADRASLNDQQEAAPRL